MNIYENMLEEGFASFFITPAIIPETEEKNRLSVFSWKINRFEFVGIKKNSPKSSGLFFYFFSIFTNVSLGIDTFPNCFIFFFPSFCFSNNFRFRVMSPP